MSAAPPLRRTVACGPAPTTPATGSAYSPYSARDAIGDTVVEAHRHGYNNREIAELTATIEQLS